MKARSQYVCQQCGYSQVGWAGKCPNCNSWGSLVETVVSTVHSAQGKVHSENGAKVIRLTDIKTSNLARLSTKIPELDRVLGGGLVPGQVVLIAGEPGIGKSTLLLQVAENLKNFLYVSGEESAYQIKIRAERLGFKKSILNVLETTNIDTLSDQVFKGMVVDSIQTMRTEDLTGLAGSVGQVRECAFRLVKIAKSQNIPIFIVGHVTKEGTVAGPAVLAHIVDTVLWFEGEKTGTLRILRSVKNRFGPTDEVGVFEMQDSGLASQTNAEKIFLTNTRKQVPGTCVSSILQGSRPILVEIESLVTPSKSTFPKRIAQGIDPRRLEILLAVLIKHCRLPLYEFDVFVNVAGGIRVEEPSADLAICLSLASSFYNQPLSKGTIAIGEVGLLGEIRNVPAGDKRAREAKRLGFPNTLTHKEFPYISQAIKNNLKNTS